VNGRIYTVCDDGTTNGGASNTRAGRIYDGSASGATNTRVGRIYDDTRVRDDDRSYVEQPKAKGKGKYKKPHGHDEDEDRN
jgi:hypothetical protein